MLSLLLQLGLALVILSVLGVALKIVVFPIALVVGLLGFIAQNLLPIAVVGGVAWYLAYRTQKRLPGA